MLDVCGMTDASDMPQHAELGKISDVYFGRESHGIITLLLTIDFGCSGQSFGGYALDKHDPGKDRRVGTSAGMDFVLRVLGLFNVSQLTGIIGRYVYALREAPLGPIVGLKLPECDGGAVFLVRDWQKEWNETPASPTAASS